MKILGKEYFEYIYKNRYLLLSCVVLLLGTVFGTSMLKIMSDEICRNIYIFISSDTDNLQNIFMNIFAFPFLTLILIFLSGTSFLGKITVPLMIFINGFVYGLKNAIFYSNSGADYITYDVISFFTSTLFFAFSLIIMSENSIVMSNMILEFIKKPNAEKPHYNAKKQYVKLATFTAVFVLISILSAQITLFIRSAL